VDGERLSGALDALITALEPRAQAISGGPRDPVIKEFLLGPNYRGDTAGISVTEHTALNFSAVYRAVHLIASSVCTLPLHVYERIGEDRKRAEHPLESVLNDEPNPEMDAATFRETLTGHVLTWGNGYAEIEYDNAGRVLHLWPMAPDRVTPERAGGTLVYKLRLADGGQKTLTRDRVLHLCGLGFDGVVGYSPVRMAAQSIGLGLAAEEFGATFFGKGTHLGGIIARPKDTPWKDEAARRFRDDFTNFHAGLGKSHKVAVLEDGMSWQALGVPPEEAQFLETRKFQVTEIARWFGVPPHKLYDLERSTNNNIEHQGIEWLSDTLSYWLGKWERAIKRSLFSPDEKRRYYAEHVTDAIVRADIAARYAAYSVGRAGGWLNVNEIRRKENMPPIEGGEVYLQPLNMSEAGAINAGPPAPEANEVKDE
jgi:HK97 family phage portal protein